MVTVDYSDSFKREVAKKKDASVRERIEKLLRKIKDDPEVGKPMKYDRKGTREVYSGSFRLSYLYDKNKDLIYFVAFYHKDEQ
ncbi:type II toxin-antitoxin system RelE/ParE family toxin [Candidatus Pacearchaeota archaeon]|nr:type II toxin-antitoxin system RelE/ParE family toxin [Candidatus Pacearchaeota archaeon]